MRKFRFIGSQKEKHISYLINFSVGECYNENRRAFRDSPLTIQDAALMYPKDWEEVIEKRTHKDTDLGYFAGEFLKVILSKNYDPVCGLANSYEDMVQIAKNIAKELIKQLDAESK